MRKLLWLFIALPLIIGTSCKNMFGKRVKGDGNIQTEDRSVGDFKNVSVSGAAKVYVSQGDSHIVKLEGDDNILKYIEVVHEGDWVKVRTKQGYNLQPTESVKVYVTAPVYNNIETSGACDILGQTKLVNAEDLRLDVTGAGKIQMEVNAPRLKAEISGSGSINLKGETKDVDLDLTGAGHAHCFDLLAENTKVDISGAGSAEVFASVRLDADVSGAGHVSYKGNASDVHQTVSGAGSVKKVN